MGKTIKIILLIFVLTLYFLAVNFISLFNFSLIINGNENKISQSTTEQASFGDSVLITSFHDGWFWNIRTFHYPDYKDSTIYFLGFIPLPLIIHNFSLFYLHLVIGLLSSVSFLIILFSTERRYYG